MAELDLGSEIRIPPIVLKIMHDKEMIKRILITLGIVIVYRLIVYIPIPGLDFNALRIFFNNIAKTQHGVTFGILNIFSGGAMQRLTILALGLMPYFSSCILVQLLGAFVPFFRKYYIIGGREGRKKIVRSVYFLTITLSAIQAFFISLWLENPARFQGLNLVTSPGWGFRITTVVSLMAGVLLLLWLAELINNYGFGNGVAILLLFGIISRLPSVIFQLISASKYHLLASGQLFILLLIFIGSIVIIWLITKSTQKIPINFNNPEINSSITLRFSWVGEVPLGFAQSIILFPATIAAIIPSLNKFATQLLRGELLYTIAYCLLIVFFTYFYIAIVFNPKDIVNKMEKYNCQIENVKLSKETEEYLDSKMTKNAIITALFLIAVAILPDIYIKLFSVPYSVITFIGGTSLIIMIGIFYDLKCQMDAYLKMKEDRSVDRWKIVDIAADEIEAEIKKGFLEAKGISCVIEPLRLTWGMPIKTVVDQYRLYIPDRKKEEAKEILI